MGALQPFIYNLCFFRAINSITEGRHYCIVVFVTVLSLVFQCVHLSEQSIHTLYIMYICIYYYTKYTLKVTLPLAVLVLKVYSFGQNNNDLREKTLIETLLIRSTAATLAFVLSILPSSEKSPSVSSKTSPKVIATTSQFCRFPYTCNECMKQSHRYQYAV